MISDRQTGFTDADWTHRWYSTGRPAGDGKVYAYLRTTGLWRKGLFHPAHVTEHAARCRIDEPGKICVTAPYPIPVRLLNRKTFSCREPNPMRDRLWRIHDRWDKSGRPPAGASR